MNNGKYLFAQVASFLPPRIFEMLQILSASLFDKTYINDLLQSSVFKDVEKQKYALLKMELIKLTLVLGNR